MPIETGGKVVMSALEGLKAAPLAIALLLGNVLFLAFAAYLLGAVSANSSERNKAQLELINSLVRDIRDCRSPRTNSKSGLFKDYLQDIHK